MLIPKSTEELEQIEKANKERELKEENVTDESVTEKESVADTESNETKADPNEEFKVNIKALSHKTLEFIKQAGKQIMKKEEENKEEHIKGVYTASGKTNYIHDFFSHRQNLGLTLSVLALAISSIAFFKAGNIPSGAFIEAENDLTTSTVAHVTPNGDAVSEVYSFGSEEEFNIAVAKAIKSQQLIPEQQEISDDNFNARVARAIDELRTENLVNEIKGKKEKYKEASDTVPAGRHLYGNVNARFIIQEFSDIECPFCKRFFETPKAVADRSNGQVAVEWFHTPLSFHDPAATNEAVATECVAKLGGNRSFWTSLQHLFDTTYGNGQGSPVLGDLAKAFKINEDDYLKCINDPAISNSIQKNIQLAASKGITGTPASIIVDTKTGRTVTVSGAQDAAALMSAIENLNAEVETAPVVQNTAEPVAAPAANELPANN